MRENRAPWLRAGYCLLLAVAGWACLLPSSGIDDRVRDALSHCRDSPGAPPYAPAPAVAGLVLDLAAVGRGLVQLAVVLRRRDRSIGTGHALLAVALPVTVLLGALQVTAVSVVRQELGPQRSPCAGAAVPLSSRR